MLLARRGARHSAVAMHAAIDPEGAGASSSALLSPVGPALIIATTPLHRMIAINTAKAEMRELKTATVPTEDVRWRTLRTVPRLHFLAYRRSRCSFLKRTQLSANERTL